jgi:RNA polymerase sigma factor (sigma-70 family)
MQTAEVWTQWWKESRAYFLRRRLDRHSAEELAQEVCFRAWKSYKEGKVEQLEKGWVCAIRWRVLADHYRASEGIQNVLRRQATRYSRVQGMVVLTVGGMDLKHVCAEPSTSTWNVEGEVVSLDLLRRILEDAQSDLLDSWRPLIADRLDGMSMKEIARTRGMTLETVRMRLFRGRRCLKKLIIERLRKEDWAYEPCR